MPRYVTTLGLLLTIIVTAMAMPTAQAARQYIAPFDDRPLTTPLELPAWFKLSFLDLREDVAEAKAAGKQGIIIYFGQKECPYCKAQLTQNWGRTDIRTYTQKHFDVIAIDVKGDRQVTDLDGTVVEEKAFARLNQAQFTPSLIFYDTEGKQVFKLYGLYPPYKFQAALEFVADRHYLQESFRDYLARGELLKDEGSSQLHGHPAFQAPPYRIGHSDKPVLVVFEQTGCYACDVLHEGPLADPEIIRQLQSLHVIQLDMWSEQQQVELADGRRLSARQWAEELGLFYTPSLIFFDPEGREIIRVDSIVWLYRLHNVLRYVNSGAYRHYADFQQWRQAGGKRD